MRELNINSDDLLHAEKAPARELVSIKPGKMLKDKENFVPKMNSTIEHIY